MNKRDFVDDIAFGVMETLPLKKKVVRKISDTLKNILRKN